MPVFSGTDFFLVKRVNFERVSKFLEPVKCVVIVNMMSYKCYNVIYFIFYS